ncbi:MAG: GNAT family N-acetyltransferase [Burkholderiales bacterium]|nr:GNAT family N-acetyltransferase [Burkholderiales bacterium]
MTTATAPAKRSRAPARRARPPRADADAVTTRPARRGDLPHVVAIDAAVTGIAKPSYWQSVFRRYGNGGQAGRQFLVADAGGRVRGFIIGEVRDWEFGSPPCGWVFAIDVEPDYRLAGVGARLLAAICAGFRRAGVTKVRTLLARENTLVLSFFRSQGMMAGPFIPLEMDLES